jgi:beta-glucosidase
VSQAADEPTSRAEGGLREAAIKGSLLGEGFAVGVSTAGYQVEGGYNGDGDPANNWLDWERVERAERSGVACDFWAHPEEILDRAAAIGSNAFRLSVEWARLEPDAGRFDEAALTRYVEILEMCATRGLEPIVTLHHFTHPAWLGEEFWLRSASPDIFARHVQRVVPALAPYCRRWVTINEPHVVMSMGWISGQHPPGRHQAFADAFCVMDNLLAAHVLAADAIVAVQPEAQVTCSNSASSIYEFDRLLTDLLLLRAAGIPASDVDRYIDERRALHDAAFLPQHAGEFALRKIAAALSPYGTNRSAGGGPLWGHWRGTLRRPAPRRVLDVVYASPQRSTWGALGFDWYAPIASHALRIPRRERRDGGTEWKMRRDLWDVPVNAPGLGSWCQTESALHGGLPLWVVENGMATRVRDHRSRPREDGWDRPRYLRAHFAAVADAVAAGAPVTTYLHWTLVDNYEWGSYAPRFGIFGMERNDEDGTVRWLDTDAAGDDAAGTFGRVVRGLTAGDGSVLEDSA